MRHSSIQKICPEESWEISGKDCTFVVRVMKTSEAFPSSPSPALNLDAMLEPLQSLCDQEGKTKNVINIPAQTLWSSRTNASSQLWAVGLCKKITLSD